MHIIKIRVKGMVDVASAERLSALLESLPTVSRIDTNLEKGLVRIASDAPLTVPEIGRAVADRGYIVEEIASAPAPTVTKVFVQGMSCRSCEVKVERAWKKIPGVRAVDVNAAKGTARIQHDPGASPTLDSLNIPLAEHGYRVSEEAREGLKSPKNARFNEGAPGETRPSFFGLVALFASVLVLGSILGRLGLLNLKAGVGSASGFTAIFLLGLVAASSSCLAVAGGLMLSWMGKFSERRADSPLSARARPVLLFVSGRLASYAGFGGLIGVLGNALSPSPAVTGAITLLAALYMLVMGLEMLRIAPRWLAALLPRMPKFLAHRVMDAEGRAHPLVPFFLGAGTFFLPCGFTQSLQLAALASGSSVFGASSLFAFALGTTPALLALGFASNSLKGVAGRFFFRFSGALVVILGFWNIQNGLAIAGYPVEFPRLGTSRAVARGNEVGVVRMENNTQVVDIDAEWSGYDPDFFTLKAGIPAVLRITGEAAQGCASIFSVPKLGIRDQISPNRITEIAFTPDKPGNYPFSCSMGMLRGRFEVVM